MADEYILKHLQDVLDAINELESFSQVIQSVLTNSKKMGCAFAP